MLTGTSVRRTVVAFIVFFKRVIFGARRVIEIYSKVSELKRSVVYSYIRERFYFQRCFVQKYAVPRERADKRKCQAPELCSKPTPPSPRAQDIVIHARSLPSPRPQRNLSTRRT